MKKMAKKISIVYEMKLINKRLAKAANISISVSGQRALEKWRRNEISS
jgi:hypothetical protein